METIVIHLDTTANKLKVKEAIKMLKGVKSVSEKITKSDFESLADDILIREMKKAEKTGLLSYTEGKKEFAMLKKRCKK